MNKLTQYATFGSQGELMFLGQSDETINLRDSTDQLLFLKKCQNKYFENHRNPNLRYKKTLNTINCH